MDSGRRVTRGYAKSMENMGKTISMEHESDRVVSESELDCTVRHIDDSLLKGNQEDKKVSADTIRDMVSEAVQKQLMSVITNLENNLYLRMNEIITHLISTEQKSEESDRKHSSTMSVVRNSDERRLNRPLEMHKWNVYFSGIDKDLRIDQFILRVEHIAVTQGVSLQEVANNLYILLKGQAANWYFQWIQRNNDITWDSLKSALCIQFRTCETDYDLEHRMMNRLQKYNESFDQFYNEILDLNSRMSRPRSDRDLIEIMKRNISSRMLIFIHNTMSQTLPEFLLECRRAEKNVSKIESGFNRTFLKPKVNEVELVSGEADNNEDFIEAFSRSKPAQDVSDITCFDCKEKGHFAFNCTKKSGRVFCYKCGRDNYVISNCPYCVEGNLKKNRKSGDPVQ